MICLRLFHLVPRSHQISKSKGGGAGREQEVPRHSSCHPCSPPPRPRLYTPKPGRGGGVHEDVLPFAPARCFNAPPCLPHIPAAITRGPGTPMAVLFPALPGTPLPCSSLALRRQDWCSCQPGSGRESKSSFANAAEITGFISGHMVVSSGTEEAAAASLPNS